MLVDKGIDKGIRDEQQKRACDLGKRFLANYTSKLYRHRINGIV